MKKDKIVIYQVLPRLFGNKNSTRKPNGSLQENGSGKMADFTHKALESIKQLGATHIWYTGIIEHATQTEFKDQGIPADHPAVLKGIAGSPYAIKDYYDIAPALATQVDKRLTEFENLVNRSHQNDLGVILDFVPNHVARSYKSDSQPKDINDLGATDDQTLSFSPYNNFYYIPNTPFTPQFDTNDPEFGPYVEIPARVTGNDQFTPSPHINDWYETIKLNYGVDYQNGGKQHFDPIPDTWLKMRDILLYWADKKVDGFRCDMAEMVPVEFWNWVIQEVKKQYPEILFIAEVYDPNQYRNYLFQGKFDYLYDKVGLYDTLRAIVENRASTQSITHCWQSLDGITDRMLNFLENHDEQRIASDFFAREPQKAIPAMVVSSLLNTNPIMIYFGQEFGESGMDEEGFSGLDGRTTIFDYWSLDSIQRWSNGGKFDGGKLTNEEKNLYATYKQIVKIAATEKAISQGLFFDLMYVNPHSAHFDSNRQYAFLRKYKNQLLVVIANFSGETIETKLNIPQHAFDFLNLTPKEEYKTQELMSDTKETVTLSPHTPLTTSVGAYHSKVLKITLEK